MLGHGSPLNRCMSCALELDSERRLTPIKIPHGFRMHDIDFHVGDFVYLPPKANHPPTFLIARIEEIMTETFKVRVRHFDRQNRSDHDHPKYFDEVLTFGITQGQI